jgi:hypothetical protein
VPAPSATHRAGTGGRRRTELDAYINVSHFLAFVQSKARISLKNHSANSSAA